MSSRRYHGLELDAFQEQSLDAIDAGLSVIVAAPTGTGKTLVADYLIEKAMQQHLRAIYTAPIKALSNQKFKDFRRQFGPDSVGIMTGDVVLNPTAPLIIMTTEIFRNQVITEDPSLQFVSYVIFDEIHWLNDEERGTVWEESIILAPAHIKILGLSATIANARHLVHWIESIRQEKVVLIEEQHRIVPLEYYYYTKATGITNHDHLWKHYLRLRKERQKDPHKEQEKFPASTHLDLIQAIDQHYLPVLYFIFSRKQCSEKARELAQTKNYLRSAQRHQVEEMFRQQFGAEENWSASTRYLKRVCVKGIAYHHAGLLPSQKVIVEELFQARLIQILYCTETFSVGINYPVKSVCFDSLRKFDGHNFRNLVNHEFFQMSGRAGRRGIDEKGYSFILVDFNYLERESLPRFNLNQLEPLSSQLKLSYNTVLNLTATLHQDQIELYFQKSFAAYSYNQTYTTLQSNILQIEKQLADTAEQVCQSVGSYHCPLKYYPQRTELNRLRLAYQKLGPNRRKKIYGREMSRKIKRLEAQLSKAPKECDDARLSICRTKSKHFFQLQQQHKELHSELSSLPAPDAFLKEFSYKQAHLQQMGYLREKELLARGECASKIYVQELLVTELIYSGIFANLSDDQINALLSCIDFDARKNDFFQRAKVLDWEPVYEIIQYIQSVCGTTSVRFDPKVAVITFAWSQGESFTNIQRLCNLDEGDIISIFRRTIDLLRQMRDAVNDSSLRNRLKECMNKLDRDEASVIEIS